MLLLTKCAFNSASLWGDASISVVRVSFCNLTVSVLRNSFIRMAAFSRLFNTVIVRFLAPVIFIPGLSNYGWNSIPYVFSARLQHHVKREDSRAVRAKVVMFMKLYQFFMPTEIARIASVHSVTVIISAVKMPGSLLMSSLSTMT